jgi:hypothetical protein
VVLVQPANKKLVARSLLLAASLTSPAVYASTSIEAGWARFYGETFNGDLKLLQLTHEANYLTPDQAGWLTSISASQSSDPISRGYSLGLDQGLGNGLAVGATGAKSKGSVDQTAISGRASMWWRENTLRTQVEYSQQSSTRDARDYLDTDGIRVRVASDAKGRTATLRLTHLTTPTTILLGDGSQTTSDGRPMSLSYGTEIRQYIEPTQSALHLRFSHYEDRGSIEPTTDFGNVIANTGSVRWNQRLPLFLLASLTGRIHHEVETPRSLDSLKLTRDATGGSAAIKWRHVKSAWTDDTSEIGIFFGAYRTIEHTDDVMTRGMIRSIGIDGRLVI